jgi:hypothetical protein
LDVVCACGTGVAVLACPLEDAMGVACGVVFLLVLVGCTRGIDVLEIIFACMSTMAPCTFCCAAEARLMFTITLNPTILTTRKAVTPMDIIAVFFCIYKIRHTFYAAKRNIFALAPFTHDKSYGERHHAS